MLSPKKACGVVTTSLAVLLAAAACGAPDAAPKPAPSIPTISAVTTSAQVSSTPVPSNNDITVRPTEVPTTSEEPAVVEPEPEPTTEAPAPPPEPTATPPPPEETTDPPVEGPFVLQGTACPVEGALAVNRRLKPMVCTAGGGDDLRWQPL
ncbi:hypothetical protein ACFFQW_28180 [Umezawaea endophytica]|uniref:Uncharacterized protein n=1 Tax=Umezawaea endophytica TaxID=1654476 RepID=A0A9X3AIR8_9PSEU|nr:hypothetical protein [Umezawaea endophytica]MCS7480870.1 hypothetical protein [Umezawaea endophytica]